jgi:Fe-Mn family superoxide dismutase
MERFSLPSLEYEYNDLEPHIDTETMKIHHSRHHQAYVNNLNKLSSAVPRDLTLHGLISGISLGKDNYNEDDRETLLKHGGGHYNHSLFWNFMGKNTSQSDISQPLNERIVQDFGSFEKLKELFDKESIKVFGSGWAWWVYDYSTKKSFVTSTKDQVNPIMSNPNLVCLLGLDVWEHAYYLKYQNKRAEYVASFWNVVNWKRVSKIHDELVLKSKKLEVTDNGHISFD